MIKFPVTLTSEAGTPGVLLTRHCCQTNFPKSAALSKSTYNSEVCLPVSEGDLLSMLASNLIRNHLKNCKFSGHWRLKGDSSVTACTVLLWCLSRCLPYSPYVIIFQNVESVIKCRISNLYIITCMINQRGKNGRLGISV